jgi:decaprenyl-phosphate phosphoribosyltransferase
MAIESAQTIPQQTPVALFPADRPVLVTAQPPSLWVSLLQLARPRQCVKTLAVVPLPLIDAPMWNAVTLGRLGWAVVTFILVSSLIYVINDIADVRHDRLHERKRQRPVAAGLVSIPTAWMFAGCLALAVAYLMSLQPLVNSWPALVYLGLNALYSVLLKHLPLVDIFVVAIGFQLRLAMGAIAVGATISPWLAVSVFALCLFLILGKRRHEITVTDSAHRPALRGYTVRYIENLLVFTSTVATVSFLFYLSSDATLARLHGVAVLASAPFALFAVFQYLGILTIRGGGGDPVRALLRDRAMVVNAALWALVLAGVAVAARYPALMNDLLAK